MPPKTRSAGNVMGTVVTKKVVKETVQVVVSPTQDDASVEDIHNAVANASSAKEKKKVEVISTPLAPTVIRNIPVKDRSDREEEPSKRQEKQPLDEDETQPADSQELLPPPPPPQEKLVTTPPPQEAAKKRKETPGSRGAKAKGARKKKRAKVGSGEVGLTSLVYKRYIYRVLKQVQPELGMSSKAMAIVNNMMNDMCERIAEEAAKLSEYSKRKTLSSLDVQDAVKLVLPGELGKHAIAEGTKAVTRYVSNIVMGQSDKK